MIFRVNCVSLSNTNNLVNSALEPLSVETMKGENDMTLFVCWKQQVWFHSLISTCEGIGWNSAQSLKH